MSLLANAKITSVCDLDYLGGDFLPRGKGAADRLIDSFQLVTELDTLTGEVTPLARDKEEVIGEIAEWSRSPRSKPFWDLVQRAQDGKITERIGPRASFEPLQEWEGYVTKVSEKGFTARLLDITMDAGRETEEAEFSFDDASDDDLPLIHAGAVFRWSVGYEKSVTGTKHKISSIVFRRLPRWTMDEIAAARQKADAALSQIIWD